MEHKLLELFKLADLLSEKQNKVYAQIDYSANERKTLEIYIRSKEDFSFLEKCSIDLQNNPLIKWDNIIELFKFYVNGGLSNE